MNVLECRSDGFFVCLLCIFFNCHYSFPLLNSSIGRYLGKARQKRSHLLGILAFLGRRGHPGYVLGRRCRPRYLHSGGSSHSILGQRRVNTLCKETLFDLPC